ncbi:ABC-type nitrate/sulfonate/bicarbonate transport system, substrate-binding protein [Actinacidiphila yanglinensis]|uniref:ABC-type nitrate/sulfonate/bicarbonate transport system, substrate-binding protein n=1 Tax=Actinacidiphila yanglinensis TaxID=310779 RepID=A0A1H6E5V4_9ACTN|nr:ABC transporter substrate-binding protein [Actinacidiphila yanglinensis]SEG93072.1 ABC-type nitrate/sulfonate/bicarbonate transport system, substrate-binding protein [Actinacidiphila yanglinensis]
MQANSRRIRRRPLAIAGAAAAALTFTVAGCSNSSGGSSGSSSPNTINIVFGSNSASYSDLFVGVDEGIFKKHGLNVKLTTLSGGATASISALAGGHADMVYGQGSNIASAVLRGGKYTVIGMTQAHYNLQVWSNPSVSSAQGLKGKKVSSGQPGTESDQGWTSYLEANGLQRSDVTTVYTGGANTGQFTALETGGVQGTLSTPPDDLVLRSHGFRLLGDLTGLPNATDSIGVSTKWLSTHQSVAKKFIEADKEALEFVRANKAQTIKSIEKHTRSANTDDATEAYEFYLKVLNPTPVLNDEDIAALKLGFASAAKSAGRTAPADITPYYKVIS